MRRLCSTTLLLLFSLITTATMAATESASVADLHWMTGTWAGPVGDGRLEETWVTPRDHSMGAFVRMTSDAGPSMIELIVIEEQEDTLILRLQQWNPGFEPRTEVPQTLKLTTMSSRMVSFEAVTEGGMQTLAYERPDDNSFNIHIETTTGRSITIPLQRQH
ncbi:MAG: hypothetical protein KDI36_01360 [Pseudomonadales bacterium]|nr:hypothetical protein [Pseudomonadales bacterium]